MDEDFFSDGGMNSSKVLIPPKMALGEGILFPLLGERLRRRRGGKRKYLQEKTGIFAKVR